MKIRIFKRILPFVLLLTLLSPIIGRAEPISENNTILVNYENGLNADNIPDYIIQEIIDSNPDAGAITIYEIGYFEPYEENVGKSNDLEQSHNYILYPPIYLDLVTDKRNLYTGVVLSDTFQFSVAKGQSVTLTKTYSVTLSSSISGIPFESAKIGISGSVTGSYTRSTTFTGPNSSDGNYNSREFRTKIFGDSGMWSQKANVWKFDGVSYKNCGDVSESGTWVQPTHYANYSIDTLH